MPENDFEKQVQHKMDEFRLRPSAPVWEKIKDDLNERKRRRLFFMISLTAAALLFCWIGYNYFYTVNTIKTNLNDTAVKNNAAIQSPTENEISNSPETTKALKDIPVATKQADGLTNADGNKTGKEQSNQNTVHSDGEIISGETAGDINKEKKQLKKIGVTKQASNKTPVYEKIEKAEKGKNSSLVSHANNKPVNDLQNINSSVKEEDRVDVTGISEKDFATVIQLKKDETPVLLSDITPFTMDAGIAANNAPVVIVPAIAAPVPSQFSRKIKWGLNVAGGASSRAKEPFDFFSSASAEKALFDASPPFQQGNITGGVLVLPPSDVKPGFAFKAGVILEKPLSRKFTVSSGLQYAYSSDHIAVGKSVNTASANLSTFYSATANRGNGTPEMTDYTNKYHFIELPVQVQYTINKKWKNPLTWNAGASVSRLVASDALLYDVAYGGVYYDANSSIRKTQFNVFTGFAFRFTVNRLQWSMGPQVAINTSRLFEDSYDNNRHSVFGGLNVRLIFPGKKK